MTNLHYTPLPISQQLASLGIEVESEHYWGWIEAHQDYEFDNGQGPAYHSYSLGDLPAVLKAVGEKKGWEEKYYYTNLNAFGEGEEYWFGSKCKNDRPKWEYHFLEICRRFATDPNAAWKYLGEIIS